MRWLRRIPAMTGMWLTMGGLVTAGFFSVRYDAYQRCEDGNEFRRVELPMAFDEFGKFLGQEFEADPDQVADARARFAVVMDETFPEHDCSLL